MEARTDWPDQAPAPFGSSGFFSKISLEFTISFAYNVVSHVEFLVLDPMVLTKCLGKFAGARNRCVKSWF